VTALAACQSGQPSSTVDNPDPGDTPAAPLSVGPERQADLATHAVLAFRAASGGFAGGYTTHHAMVRDGIVEITPYTFSGGERQAREPLILETTSITRDGVWLGALTGTRLEDGAVILERDQRGQIAEHLRNEANGVHQEWQFQDAPQPSGDIVVEVSVAGHTYVGTTAAGVHFASATGAGFAYSNAVWISADGTAWPIAAVHDHGRIRMTVPQSVVARTTFPAVLDPTISPELGVDTPVVGLTGTNTQNPAIAFNGTSYLVVWEDERNSSDSDIWGTRLDASGAIVDALGIEIATAPGKQRNPTVAFDGTSYVVAWEDFKVARGTEADIVAATVDPSSGAVTSLPAVAATATHETQPSLAGGGGAALLAWNAGGDIVGAIHRGGFGAPFAIAATAALEVAPAVALSPAGNYLVAWSEGAAATADVRGQMVTQTGTLSGAALDVSAGAGAQSSPAAAFDGTTFAVVWINNNAGLSVAGTRVSAAGVVLDTHLEGALTVGGVPLTAAPAVPDLPSIACIASGCTVLWQERRNLATTGFDIHGQILQPDFTRQGGEIIVSNAGRAQLSPVIVAAGSALFSTWFDTRDGETNTVFGVTLSSAGVPGTEHPLVSGNNRESQPAVGTAGTTFGLFWSDSRTFGNDIRFTRFSASGSKLDATPRVGSGATNAQLSPAASGDLGGNTLVVWADTRLGASKDIFGARVSLATGASLDGDGFAIATAAADQLLPSVASNGTVALVTWQDRRNGTFDIFGALVNSAGTVTISDIAISSSAPGDQLHPTVTWNGASSQFIVVWSDNRSGTSHILGARVSPAGAVLDPDGIAISNGAVGQFAPSIASDAAGSVAVWEDRQQGQDIFGTRLAGGAALGVLDPGGIAISTAAGGQTSPRITSIGTSYLVVWVDSRNTQTDIFGQQLTTSGGPSGAEFAVSNTADDELNAAIFKGPGNNLALAAYETRRLNTSRVAARLITSQTPNGSVCSSAAQCQSGFCVDGRCCDTACGGGITTDCQACAFARTNQPDGLCSPIPSTSICRNYASTFCDEREYCDGVNPECPADVGRNEGLTCNKATNVPAGTGTGICPSEAAPGPHACL
jgi:hypothetical protein